MVESLIWEHFHTQIEDQESPKPSPLFLPSWFHFWALPLWLILATTPGLSPSLPCLILLDYSNQLPQMWWLTQQKHIFQPWKTESYFGRAKLTQVSRGNSSSSPSFQWLQHSLFLSASLLQSPLRFHMAPISSHVPVQSPPLIRMPGIGI